jgi:hypothetical protein
MEKNYPGKLLYEFSFVAGYDLYQYAATLKDDYLRQLIRDIAIKVYFNRFPPYLCRSGWRERRIFYHYVKANYVNRVKPVKCNMQILPKLLVSPFVGPILAEMASIVYKIKHLR